MKFFVAVLFLGFFLFSCTKSKTDLDKQIILDSLKSEELKITFINDTIEARRYIDSLKSFWIPTQANLNIIDSILVKAIIENKNRNFINLTTNSYKDYYRQYICYINIAGDSIAYINALCHFMNELVFDENNNTSSVRPDWQHYMIDVDDGGDCHWRIRINLSKQDYFSFVVNGRV